MTALQLNSEFFAVMSQIAARKGLLQEVLNFAKALLAKKDDETQMTKEEFFRRIDEAKKGESESFDNADDLDKYIKGQRG
jgi:hypothetical protein